MFLTLRVNGKVQIVNAEFLKISFIMLSFPGLLQQLTMKVDGLGDQLRIHIGSWIHLIHGCRKKQPKTNLETKIRLQFNFDLYEIKLITDEIKLITYNYSSCCLRVMVF